MHAACLLSRKIQNTFPSLQRQTKTNRFIARGERGAMKIGRMSGEIPRNGNVLATLLTPTGEERMR